MDLSIPQVITQGDRVIWQEDIFMFDPAKHTLAYFIRGESGSLNLTAIGTSFEISGDQSIGIEPGRYKAQLVFFGLSIRQTLGVVDLQVNPSFENLTTVETKTPDEIELEAITKAIAIVASGGVAEYYIGDRRVRYQDLTGLTERQNYLRRRIAFKLNPGLIGGRNVGVGFTS